MARTLTPRPIFNRKSRLRLRGLLGGALLLLSLAALIGGIFGALYLDHLGPAAPVEAARHAAPDRPFAIAQQAVAVEAVPSHAPESPPSGPPPLPADLGLSTATAAPAAVPSQPAVAGASGSSEPPAATPQPQTAPVAQAPSPAPAASPTTETAALSPTASDASSGVYWIEYGAYATPHYAERLRQSLAKLGLETRLSYVPGRGGRHYYSVRSTTDRDRSAALAAADQAAKALHITPLLHREHRHHATPRVATAAPGAGRHHPAHTAHNSRYWVQFGAFAIHSNAVRLTARLRDHGIAASISPRRRETGHLLYFVRCSPLPDRESAGTVADEARALLGTAVLIGQSAPTSNG